MQSCQTIHPGTGIVDVDGDKISTVREHSEGNAPTSDDAGAMQVAVEPLDLSGQLYIPLSTARDLCEGGGLSEPDRVLTVPAVAELLHVRPETVRRWVRKGELRGCLLDGAKRGYGIRASEVGHFVVARAARTRPAR